LRVLIYALQTAFQSLWHEKWVNFLTILSISIGLLILSAFVTITLNVDSTLTKWAKSFGLVVYLNEDLKKEAEETIKDFFQQDSDIVEVQYITKDRALIELKQMLGADAPILDDIGENPLPSSFELKLKGELLKPAIVKQKAYEIEQMSGVEEVQYGEKWLSSLNAVSKIMKISATFLGISIFIAIIFITYNTIKIFFFRRKDEIETLKLLGATRTFIRLPFLIEGLFIGILGGIIGSLALFGTLSFITIKGAEFFPSMKAIMILLPVQIYVFIPIAGAVMSVTGSFFAVGKIRY
jgi:cell division transport system permease protein